MEERTYTEAEYQKMATAQYAAGLAAAMKEAGFAPPKGEDMKRQITAFRAHVDAERAKADGLSRQLHAVSRGVPQARMARYMALADTYLAEDNDFGAALDAALADFPLPTVDTAPQITASTTGPGDSDIRWQDLPLKDRAALYLKEPERARKLAREAGEKL